MSQRKEKYARSMERRVVGLESVMAAQKERITTLEEGQTEQYIARIVDSAYAQRAEEGADMKIRRYRGETERTMARQSKLLMLVMVLAIIAVIMSTVAVCTAGEAKAAERPAVTEMEPPPGPLEEHARDVVDIRWAEESGAVPTEYVDAALEILERPEHTVSAWTGG